MRNGAKIWSEDEILRLREIMTRYTKDKEGCKFAAQELNRPYSGVLAKWYEIKPKTTKPSTQEVKDILYRNISKNPGNLQEAFRLTAEQTNRKASTIQKGYYSKTSDYSKYKFSTCFAILSKDKVSANCKNFNSSRMPKTTKRRIKLWIASILGIKKEDL